MKVKAVRPGYWGGVLRPAGNIFDIGDEKPGSWMAPVSAKDARAMPAPHAPGLNRPQTPAEAGVPAGAPIETDPEDPNLVDLAEIGAAAAPAAPTGVSEEDVAKAAKAAKRS